ncbi:hypothetical protein Taro_034581 [Colocasia esculenta]|uniref:Uncharacterized protein n=1 Tax=Colocasia esculenta TaxID=4460 RepID=A0A843VWR7_COLES|nr:hypothetical protein [Colocasia esculenta]
MAAIVGAKEGGPVDVGMVAGEEVVEQVGGLQQAGVEAWGCGLCQGHLSVAMAVVVVVVASTVVGRVPPINREL